MEMCNRTSCLASVEKHYLVTAFIAKERDNHSNATEKVVEKREVVRNEQPTAVHFTTIVLLTTVIVFVIFFSGCAKILKLNYKTKN